MIIILDIPNYEFDNDIKDKFQDFFHRVYADIADPESIMCGNYERETAEMFLASFKRAAYLPKDMTNGDVIQAIFPNAPIDTELYTNYVMVKLDYHTQYDGGLMFDKEWWNAPYKKENKYD